jgi:hypothetical protein
MIGGSVPAATTATPSSLSSAAAAAAAAIFGYGCISNIIVASWMLMMMMGLSAIVPL